MHLKDEFLCAYRDKELSGRQSQQVREHLEHCSSCQDRLKELSLHAQQIQHHLDVLAPGQLDQPRSTQAAYQHFIRSSRYTRPQKEIQKTMSTRRPLWAALAIVVALALVFTLTPANAWASSVLSLFRVQKVQVITFDPAAAQNAQNQLKSEQDVIKQVFKDDLKITKHGEMTTVASAAEAKDQVGFTPRVPAALKDATINVQPGMNAVFTINQPKLQSILDAVGIDAKLPAEVNGKVITVDVPDAVAVSSGCPTSPSALQEESQLPANCTSLVQVPSPTVNTPAGLDVPQLADAMFQYLGLSPADAKQLSQRIDWTTTLVVPIPQGGQIQYQDVQVDGVTGTLFQEADSGRYSLIWVKNGVLYGLSGSGSTEQALSIAGSLQ